MLPGPWDASQWELPRLTFLQMLWLRFLLEQMYMNEWMHSWRNTYFIDLMTIFIMIQYRAQNSLFSRMVYSFSALLVKKTFFHTSVRLWYLCCRSVDHASMIPFLNHPLCSIFLYLCHHQIVFLLHYQYSQPMWSHAFPESGFCPTRAPKTHKITSTWAKAIYFAVVCTE